MRYGQRGIAIAGSLAHLVAYVFICIHPPYPVLVVLFILAGYGNGAFGMPTLCAFPGLSFANLACETVLGTHG